MRVKGRIEVEGVTLVVDIEAPDDQQEVFVTNIDPSVLTIPKGRWSLDFLGLPEKVVGKLQGCGLRTLGDITDEHWQVQLPSDLTDHLEVVTEAVVRLREIALTFEPSEEDAITSNKGKHPFPLPEEDGQEEPEEPTTKTVSGTDSLISIGVPAETVNILAQERGITTIQDLIQLGRRKVVMTTGININNVKTLDEKLAEAGFSWNHK